MSNQVTPFVITKPKELNIPVTVNTGGERECGVYSVLITWEVHKTSSIRPPMGYPFGISVLDLGTWNSALAPGQAPDIIKLLMILEDVLPDTFLISDLQLL